MYLWTQFPNIIIKQFISRGKRFGQDRQNENSDNEHEQKGGDEYNCRRGPQLVKERKRIEQLLGVIGE